MKKRMIRAVAMTLTALMLLLSCGCQTVEKEKPFVDAPFMDGPPSFELGNSAGAISAGGYTLHREYWDWNDQHEYVHYWSLFVALEDGIYKQSEEAGKFKRISRDVSSCLNLWDGRLCYIRTFEEKGVVYEEIVSTDLDGNDKMQHAPPLAVEDRRVTHDPVDASVNCTVRSGYTDFYVGENTLFFIADNNTPGSAAVQLRDGTRRTVRWDTGHALHVLDLDSGEDTTLVREIGNGACPLYAALPP